MGERFDRPCQRIRVQAGWVGEVSLEHDVVGTEGFDCPVQMLLLEPVASVHLAPEVLRWLD